MTPGAPAELSGHIRALDGVRGLAILAVSVHTLTDIELPSAHVFTELMRALGQPGWTGVQVFFVLSGFLITGILLDSVGSPTYFRSFYIRRALRIFPLYYLTLFFFLVVVPHSGHFPGYAAEALKNQWWYWTYMSNWVNPFGIGIQGLAHFWSLAVEEQFYVVWPLVVFLVSRRALVRTTVAMLAVTPAIRFVLDGTGFPPHAAYSFTIARWDGLAAGALLALLLREEGGREWLRRWMPVVVYGSLAALVLLVAKMRQFDASSMPIQVVGQTVAATLSAALIYAVVVRPSRVALLLKRAMSAGWLRFFGKYSYAMYVFLYPIHIVGVRFLSDSVNAGGGTARSLKLVAYMSSVFLLAVGAAMVSWRVVERPSRNLKDRLAPRVR